MAIQRWTGGAQGRSKTTTDGRYVWTVATAKDKTGDMAAQTRDVLSIIEANLKEAGSDKTRMLQATVYIANMQLKGQMDLEWNKWVPAGGEPQRACVNVGLFERDLVEVVVVALRNGVD